jgi:hypothetical protein
MWAAIHSHQEILACPGVPTYGDDMASDPPTELRLSRLENDSIALYDLIAAVSFTQQEHSRRFDAMDQRFDGVDQRFDGVDQRFDGVDQRFDAMEQRFDSVEATLAEVVRRLPEPS